MSDSEIVKEFLVESYENLDRLDQELITLEKDPTEPKILASIFRTIHTIKGTSGFLAFDKLGALTHAGESLLARLRDGQLKLNPEITTALLTMVDSVRQMLVSIEASGTEGERDDSQLIDVLTRLQRAEAGDSPRNVPAATANTVPQTNLIQAAPVEVEPTVAEESEAHHQTVGAKQKHEAGDSSQFPEKVPTQDLPSTQEAANGQSAPRGPGASDSTIRVDVCLLDQLMNLVGELVLARNQVLQFTSSREDSGLLATSQRLNLITTELQEGVMKTRMQPIGNIWSKFPRTVRDLALRCGKQVRIEMEGKDTELDKTIIEAIKDPLTHLVRNAVDHGIESSEKRKAAGKSVEGLLLLRAFHEGGQVNIEISDDGAGLNRERIVNKAVQKGLISMDQACRLSDREVGNLVFLPGFSTAEMVTNVSGRGVGLDVVKTNIEKIGGTVDMQSKPGLGSTVRLKIPLTLAIIPALIVTGAGDRYAIPQVNLLELVRLEGERARKGIEFVNGAPVHRLRGRLLPLAYLNRELKVRISTTSDSMERQGTSNKELVNFAAVRKAHKDWVERLRGVLDGKVTMTLDQAGSHKLCTLGKWIYSSGLEDYGDIAEMRTLEKAHKGFHSTVRDIVTLKLDGTQVQAEEQFRKIGPFSEKIVELLTLVEKKVAEFQNVNIVVLQADDRSFGLIVDEINDTEEIVVKPLGKQLKSIKTFAGATIMGDGKVALILDVLGLAQCANVVNEVRDHALAEKEGNGSSAAGDRSQHNAVLLFQHGENGRMAIDLSMVARLEEFPHDTIESAAGKEVVQYRGQIMPLLRVSDVLQTRTGTEPQSGRKSLQVVVYSANGKSVGLVVDRILDIVEESFEIQGQKGRKGLLGSAVIQKRITDILDLAGLIEAAEGGHATLAAHA